MVCMKTQGRQPFLSLFLRYLFHGTKSASEMGGHLHFLHYLLEMYTLTRLFIMSLCACVAVYFPIHNGSGNDWKPGFVICQLAKGNQRQWTPEHVFVGGYGAITLDLKSCG